eukprot:CAMPEP_0114568634 /NCGR_PEP_ID=MMETSP0114-20121206/16167_1 /TAXON_ID=31324 /ORGANISM="Goniomonas sp, Strain m" /LENGTH=812 /DNA_ID=CAMNT_0001755399 /DNA_START=12 /DNA_END=2450 /DNA_ORIENTATION=-
MRVLLVDAFSQRESGRLKFQRWKKAIQNAFDETRTLKHNPPVYEVRTYNQLGSYVHDGAEDKIHLNTVLNFDRTDVFFVDGDLPFKPWHPQAHQIFRLICMALQSGKCLFASSFASAFVVSALANDGKVIRLVQSFPEGGELADLRRITHMSPDEVHLVKDTGDCYRYNEETNEWTCAFNVGIRTRYQGKKLHPFKYKPKHSVHQDIKTNGIYHGPLQRTEDVFTVFRQHSDHFLFKNMPIESGVIIPMTNGWTLTVRKPFVKNFKGSVLAVTEETIVAIEAGHVVATRLAPWEHPELSRMLSNFVVAKADGILNGKLSEGKLQAEIYFSNSENPSLPIPPPSRGGTASTSGRSTVEALRCNSSHFSSFSRPATAATGTASTAVGPDGTVTKGKKSATSSGQKTAQLDPGDQALVSALTALRPSVTAGSSRPTLKPTTAIVAAAQDRATAALASQTASLYFARHRNFMASRPCTAPEPVSARHTISSRGYPLQTLADLAVFPPSTPRTKSRTFSATSSANTRITKPTSLGGEVTEDDESGDDDNDDFDDASYPSTRPTPRSRPTSAVSGASGSRPSSARPGTGSRAFVGSEDGGSVQSSRPSSAVASSRHSSRPTSAASRPQSAVSRSSDKSRPGSASRRAACGSLSARVWEALPGAGSVSMSTETFSVPPLRLSAAPATSTASNTSRHTRPSARLTARSTSTASHFTTANVNVTTHTTVHSPVTGFNAQDSALSDYFVTELIAKGCVSARLSNCQPWVQEGLRGSSRGSASAREAPTPSPAKQPSPRGSQRLQRMRAAKIVQPTRERSSMM